ncbi:hypothetical protein BH24ACT17_BH24ACT17_06670 [soil metagenome]
MYLDAKTLFAVEKYARRGAREKPEAFACLRVPGGEG